jgi:hypothetical protein
LALRSLGGLRTTTPHNDTVVRYTAGEVRKRLASYYRDRDDSAVLIGISQGSYVPEFLFRVDADEVHPIAADAGLDAQAGALATASIANVAPTQAERETPLFAESHARRRFSPAAGAIVVLLIATIVAGMLWSHRHYAATNALDGFWGTIVRAKGTPLLVAGGNVFSPNLYSGTETAVRSDEYPFVSMQTAAALARVSGLLQQKGSSYQMQPANGVTLSDLRDRPVVLLGAYNNEWTMRLVQNTRFRLGPATNPSILDAKHPGRIWHRDHSLPYATADDYALIGRFHDTVTGRRAVSYGCELHGASRAAHRASHRQRKS